MDVERQTILRKVTLAASVPQQAVHTLALTARGLRSAFSNAVSCLYGIKNRIVVTGMGKSGHAARKVAATLASTDSPACFIHPGKASHGDLSMIASVEALPAFSNADNTTECPDSILYVARRSIPLIGVTRNAGSRLGKHVTHMLPLVPEADPLDCAPTTSTTLHMASGDARALSLIRRRGCSPEEFHRWHPGGSSGRTLLTVRKIMHTNEDMPLLEVSATMPDTLILMTGKSFGVAGVTDNDLHRLKQSVPTVTSSSMDEADIQVKKAALIQNSVPVVSREGTISGVLLKEGDEMLIRRQTDGMHVSGEALTSTAVTGEKGNSLKGSGTDGLSDRADADILGEVSRARTQTVKPGDRISVMSRFDSRNLQLVKAVAQVLYQTTVAIKIAAGL